MPYCGCQGSQAKKLWCLTSTFTTLCLACIIGYLVTASLCGQDIIDAGCVEKRRQGYHVTSIDNDCAEEAFDGVCHATRPLIWLAILFLILAIIPCCIMCCCLSKPPISLWHYICLIVRGGVDVQKSNNYHDAPVAHTTAQHGKYDSYGGTGGHAGTYDNYGQGTTYGGNGGHAGTYDNYGQGTTYDYPNAHGTGHAGYGGGGTDVYDQYGGAPAAHHGGYTKTNHSPAV